MTIGKRKYKKGKVGFVKKFSVDEGNKINKAQILFDKD